MRLRTSINLVTKQIYNYGIFNGNPWCTYSPFVPKRDTFTLLLVHTCTQTLLFQNFMNLDPTNYYLPRGTCLIKYYQNSKKKLYTSYATNWPPCILFRVVDDLMMTFNSIIFNQEFPVSAAWISSNVQENFLLNLQCCCPTSSLLHRFFLAGAINFTHWILKCCLNPTLKVT